eukprot:TRINITY_DN3619_c0_g2_i1.p1 TRINITY_DN3619_c0_g2~~TRINITY_DN3619_c0_g2_i1.p1  ORF type:complete len:884 (+),score=168.72 TRINITY_DN3619_c0_g2_i1:81-2732(+)
MEDPSKPDVFVAPPTGLIGVEVADSPQWAAVSEPDVREANLTTTDPSNASLGTARQASKPKSVSQRALTKIMQSVTNEDLDRVHSGLSLVRPQTHQLPKYVMWGSVAMIVLGMAVVNTFMVSAEIHILHFKLDFVGELMQEHGLAVGVLVLMAMSGVLVLISACLVLFIAPVCAGSGLPEAKGYVNGNHIPGLFSVRALIVKVVGVVLSVCSGLPVGREGPMVHIGGTLGYGAVHMLALPHVRRWVRTSKGDDPGCSPALIVDTERFAHAKRIGCALGGAAGIAVAFNAPIGGILYMFEEVTVTSWAPETTIRAFVCTVCSALASVASRRLLGTEAHRLVVFDDEHHSHNNNGWDWIDIPAIIVMAALIGVVSAVYTRCLLLTFEARRKFAGSFKKFLRLPKIVEGVCFAMLCALVFACIPALFGECEPNFHSHHHYTQYHCPEGSHNEIATLLMSGAEGAVKHLYGRDNETHIEIKSLATCFVTYFVLACGNAGLPVPLGLFVPSMLMGAMFGRMWGRMLHVAGINGLASSGVYALVGSGAFLGGFTHMTIAIVVLLVEASSDLMMVPPLMVSIFVATLVNQKINPHAYDEVLILKKGVPYLESELPAEMDRVTASDLCEMLPAVGVLKPQDTLENVRIALQEPELAYFPVVSGASCVGLVTRTRLEAAYEARSSDFLRLNGPEESDMPPAPAVGAMASEEESASLRSPSIRRWASDGDQFENANDTHMNKVIQEIVAGGDDVRHHMTVNSEGHGLISVHRIMDRAPYLILADTPAARFYDLFTKCGATCACVISSEGDFRGILTKDSLISSTRDAHRPKFLRQPSPDREHAWHADASPSSAFSASPRTTRSRDYAELETLTVENQRLKERIRRLEARVNRI